VYVLYLDEENDMRQNIHYGLPLQSVP
jgi:hypothetical protein